jgi:tetratricopeptide (TPR) repeat protein
MSEPSIWDKFTDMRPIRSAPTLQTVNGIGTTIYGRRDYDPETGTYVKTHCFSVLFIPVLALGAYRVADAEGGGWYFIGKVPLSGLARAWNLLLPVLILGVAGFFWWQSHTGTPDYKAGQTLAEADRLAAEGKGRRAAEMYREVMLGKTSHAGRAEEKLRQLVASPPGSLDEAAGVYEVALDFDRRGQPLVPDLFQRGLDLSGKHETGDPAGALRVLEVVAPLAPRPEDHLKPRRRLLEQLVKRSPGDAELASRLAVVCSSQGDLARCEAVLLPHEARLSTLDGAVVLAHIHLSKNKLEPAHALLRKFVDGRLAKYQAAQKGLEDVLRQANDRIVQELRDGKAPGFDFERAKSASKEAVSRMADEYINDRLRKDPALREAARAASAEAIVGDALLDLGLVQLQRAQGLAGPKERKAELERAEQTFLSVRGAVAGSPQYKLRLGRVYYWLGRAAEGRQRFDELLKDAGRSTESLLQVADALRDVGAVSEARALAEEAHDKAPDQQHKHMAATVRALMWKDLDDKIDWLNRCDATNADTRASLCEARGERALRDGNDAEAAEQFRQALALYAAMVENAAVLNNSSLAHFALYRVTHEREQFNRGLDRLYRAIKLRPGDSILLGNAAGIELEDAVRDAIGAALDFRALKRSADFGLLPFLYRDKKGQTELMEKVRRRPSFAKARGQFEKLLVLAPKRPGSYTMLLLIAEQTNDEAGLRRLLDRLKTADLDLKDSKLETLDGYAGKNDAKHLPEWRKALARQEEAVKATRKAGGASFAVAAVALAHGKIGSAALGLPAPPDEVVKLTEEAHAGAPSSGTRSGLIEALLFRAHVALQAEADYKALAERTQRSLGADLVTFVLAREGALREKALANTDVKRALALKLEQVRAFPDQGAVSWAMLHAAHPEEAKRIAGAARKDARQELRRAIYRILAPLSTGTMLEEHYALLMAGKDDEAMAVLRRADKQGVPMPIGK